MTIEAVAAQGGVQKVTEKKGKEIITILITIIKL
jgi:hypothetical protein